MAAVPKPKRRQVMRRKIFFDHINAELDGLATLIKIIIGGLCVLLTVLLSEAIVKAVI